MEFRIFQYNKNIMYSLNRVKVHIGFNSILAHSRPITGISRHDCEKNLFTTISEDGTIRLWDYRMGSSVKLFMLK